MRNKSKKGSGLDEVLAIANIILRQADPANPLRRTRWGRSKLRRERAVPRPLSRSKH